MFTFSTNSGEYKIWFRHISCSMSIFNNPDTLWKGTTTCNMQNLTNGDTFTIHSWCSKKDNYSRYEGRVRSLHRMIRTFFPFKVDGLFSAENALVRSNIVEAYLLKSPLSKNDRESLLYDKDLIRQQKGEK